MAIQIIFEDRHDAGRRLARELEKYRAERPIVLALPRGGVPVGYEVARALDAPLDILVARKLGAPMQPELGVGAIAPGGVRILDEELIRTLGITEDELEAVAAREREEMRRRLEKYRGTSTLPDVRGRTVILVDDGLATGVTARAAVAAARARGARRVVLAIPVCARETADALAREVDDFVCASIPPRFRAVGYWYADFEQTTDAEVIELLEEARRAVSDEELSEI